MAGIKAGKKESGRPKSPDAIQFRLSISASGDVALAIDARLLKVASGGAREGAHAEAERRLVRGAKVNLGLRPFLSTASSS
jgi:hypothetical protein